MRFRKVFEILELQTLAKLIYLSLFFAVLQTKNIFHRPFTSQYGALSVWDYSPAALCSSVDTNPKLPGASKDAVFYCANKFIGGVQSPGKY